MENFENPRYGMPLHTLTICLTIVLLNRWLENRIAKSEVAGGAMSNQMGYTK
jgi:hypothetical protein